MTSSHTKARTRCVETLGSNVPRQFIIYRPQIRAAGEDPPRFVDSQPSR